MRDGLRDDGLVAFRPQIACDDPGIGAQCDRIVRMQDGEIVADETVGATAERVWNGHLNGTPVEALTVEKVAI